MIFPAGIVLQSYADMHAGTAANAAIQDALALGEALAKGKKLEHYYDERYPEWLRNYEKNGEDFEALHRPMTEWRSMLDNQETNAVRAGLKL